MGKYARGRERRASEERQTGERAVLKRESSFPPRALPQFPSLSLSIRSIFSHLRCTFSLLSLSRRTTSCLCLRCQSVPLDSPSLSSLIADIEVPTATTFLPQIDDLIRRETEDLLSFLIEEIRDCADDWRLCAGLVCDADVLLETVITGLRERGRLRKGLEEFFEGAVAVFFEEVMREPEVRRAVEDAAWDNSEVGERLRKAVQELRRREENVQVSYSTSDLLQQMSIEQVLLYINSSPDSKTKKKRRRSKKKAASQLLSADLRSLTDEEFEQLKASFQSRLEAREIRQHRDKARTSAQWIARIVSNASQAHPA